MKNITIFLTIIVVLTPFILTSETNRNLQLSLKYFSRPVINQEWEILIYRTNKKFHLKSDNYLEKTFIKQISYQQYTLLLKKLNKLGIRMATGCYQKASQNEFYQITLKTKKFTNSFKVPAKIPLYGKNALYIEMIRIIQNLARDIGKDL